jgi:hypothetical protein
MSFAEVSDVRLIRTTSASTLFCIRDVLHTGRSGVESGWGQEIFLFSITAVVPTQIYIQWVMRFHLGVKRPG